MRKVQDSVSLALTHAPKVAPWRASYAVSPTPEPPIGLVGRFIHCGGDAGPVEQRIALRAQRRVGSVSVTLLDHHADPLGAPASVDVDTSWKTIAFTLPDTFAKAPYGVEGLHVHVHDLSVAGLPKGSFDESSSPAFLPGRSLRARRYLSGGRVTGFSVGVPPKPTPSPKPE